MPNKLYHQIHLLNRLVELIEMQDADKNFKSKDMWKLEMVSVTKQLMNFECKQESTEELKNWSTEDLVLFLLRELDSTSTCYFSAQILHEILWRFDCQIDEENKIWFGYLS